MFKLPPYQKHLLENGLTVLLLKRRGLPLVSFRFLLKAGALADPARREGLASLTAEALRKGTVHRSARQFADELDFIGGSLSINTNHESTSFSAEFMSKDLEAGLDLLSEAFQHPSLPEEEVTKLARRRSDSIRQAKDNAGSVVQAYFEAFLFRGHPYGRPVSGDEESTASIERPDAAAFWESHYLPNQLIVAAVGDFEDDDLLKRIEDVFGGWGRQAVHPLEADGFSPPPGSRVLLVDKPDTNQTYFRFGSVGIERCNPDYVPIQTLNTIFGGRFTSWLNAALRINAGLTYGARSYFVAFKKPGPFGIASYTPTESTERAIDLALEQLRRLHREGICAEELASVKNYIRGQFPPSLETIDQLAGVLADLEFYGQDASFIDTYLDKVEALDVDQASRLVARYFPSEGMTYALIGEADKIRNVAAKYGPVTERPITVPGF